MVSDSKSGTHFSLKDYCNHANPTFSIYYAKHNTSFLFTLLCNMKKIILLVITLTTLANVSFASFPVIEDTLKTKVDTLTEKKDIEQYHLRLEKQGFDISNCMCVDCRQFKDITKNSNKNSDSEGNTLSPLQSAKINMLFLGSAMLIGLVTISIYIDWSDVPPVIFPIILTIFLVFYLRIIFKKMKKKSKLKK